jgi:hypothetical protein
VTLPSDDGLERAKAARRDSESELRNVERRWPMIRRLAHGLRLEREANHFAERMGPALEGDF